MGTYAVEVEARGFKIARRAGITLQIATSQELDFRLDIGDVSEVVNVEASAPKDYSPPFRTNERTCFFFDVREVLHW